MYRPVISHSTSNTLILIFGSFFYFTPPTTCPFSVNILLFKENLSETPALPGKLRNSGNSISECSTLQVKTILVATATKIFELAT